MKDLIKYIKIISIIGMILCPSIILVRYVYDKNHTLNFEEQQDLFEYGFYSSQLNNKKAIDYQLLENRKELANNLTFPFIASLVAFFFTKFGYTAAVKKIKPLIVKKINIILDYKLGFTNHEYVQHTEDLVKLGKLKEVDEKIIYTFKIDGFNSKDFKLLPFFDNSNKLKVLELNPVVELDLDFKNEILKLYTSKYGKSLLTDDKVEGGNSHFWNLDDFKLQLFMGDMFSIKYVSIDYEDKAYHTSQNDI